MYSRMYLYFQSFRHSGQAKNILEVVQRFVQPGLTHLKADCPVAVHIKHPKHLVYEDLCLVSGHQVHAHDALLVQGPARTGFDKPAEMLSLMSCQYRMRGEPEPLPHVPLVVSCVLNKELDILLTELRLSRQSFPFESS